MTATSRVPLEDKNRVPETKGIEKLSTDHNFKRKIVWFNAIGFLLLHLLALYGVVLWSFKAQYNTVIYALILLGITGQGVTMGAHRLYAHRAYKASFLLRLVLIILQTTAGQNCMYIWVRDHRQHHKYSDTDADPHNAHRGFFFSHIGWLMSRKHPLVIQKGKTVDMSDLEADNLVMLQKRFYKPLYMVFAIAIPVAIPVYFWNETYWNSIFVCYFARYIITLNFTWLVNSWAHIFGNRPYDRNILPVESRFVNIVTVGEGYHNYHHVFPWDYKASELGMTFDITTHLIDTCAFLGLASDLKSASQNMIQPRIRRTGDGSHYTLKNKVSDKIQVNGHSKSISSAQSIAEKCDLSYG